MKLRFKHILGISLSTLVLSEVHAQVLDYKPELTEQELAEDASKLNREEIIAEITRIQDELNSMRAEALRKGDVDSIQEITFVIRFGERAKGLDDVRLVNKEMLRLKEFLKSYKDWIQNS